jgi:hypothetical protein
MPTALKTITASSISSLPNTKGRSSFIVNKLLDSGWYKASIKGDFVFIHSFSKIYRT